MQAFLYYLVTFLVVAVIGVLAMGLWTMLKGGNPNLSQNLMRWRVGLQFLAIAAIIAFVIVSNLPQ